MTFSDYLNFTYFFQKEEICQLTEMNAIAPCLPDLIECLSPIAFLFDSLIPQIRLVLANFDGARFDLTSFLAQTVAPNLRREFRLTNWDRARHPIRRHLTNYAGPRVKCFGFGRVLEF